MWSLLYLLHVNNIILLSIGAKASPSKFNISRCRWGSYFYLWPIPVSMLTVTQKWQWRATFSVPCQQVFVYCGVLSQKLLTFYAPTIPKESVKTKYSVYANNVMGMLVFMRTLVVFLFCDPNLIVVGQYLILVLIPGME